jgi:hypothetical protein
MLLWQIGAFEYLVGNDKEKELAILSTGFTKQWTVRPKLPDTNHLQHEAQLSENLV